MQQPKARAKHTAVLTTLDQILSSASNALVLLSLAQVSGIQTYAIVAVVAAVVSSTLGFNRGALGTPILLISNLPRSEITRESGYAVGWSLGSGVFAALVVVLLGESLGGVRIGIAFAIALPVILIQDVLRLTAISMDRPLIAVFSDGIWTLAMLVLFLLNIVMPVETAVQAVYLWALGGLAAVIVLLIGTGVTPNFNRIWAWWRTYWLARLRFGFAGGINNIIAASVIGVAMVTVGSEASASLRGASTLFGPISMLVAAFPLVFIPHSRKSSDPISTQWHRLVRTSIVMAGVTVVGVICLLAMPESWGTAILGQTWSHAIKVIPYTGIEYGFVCCLVGVYTFLQARGMSRTIFSLRALHTVLQVGGSVFAGLLLHSARAIAGALAVTAGVIVVVGFVLVSRTVKGASSSPHEGVFLDPASPPRDRDLNLLKTELRPASRGADEKLWPLIDVLEDEINRSKLVRKAR